jgi:hypothetical protein
MSSRTNRGSRHSVRLSVGRWQGYGMALFLEAGNSVRAVAVGEEPRIFHADEVSISGPWAHLSFSN